MSVTVVVGAQWGDEGKGKVIDTLADEADMIVRFNGGGNAGHTVVIDGKKHALHLLPCGILREGTTNIVGPGVAFDLAIGVPELEIARTHGSRVILDEGAPVVLPIHRAIDAGREFAAGSAAIGTTKRGIGPTYSDFILRRGLTLGDLRSQARVIEILTQGRYWHELEQLVHSLGLYDAYDGDRIFGIDPLSLTQTIDWCMQYAEQVCDHLGDTRVVVQNAFEANRRLLFEGAQGILLDVFQGSRPFCTSSICTPAGVSVTFGIYRFDRVIGITKAYVTRVGGGPFPTELHNEVGDRLRERGHEYGTSTGRPRRCGWLDLPSLRYACRLGGVTELVVTKLDVLSAMDLQVCFRYMNGLDGSSLTSTILEKAEPVLEQVKRWEIDLSSVRALSDLPIEAQEYLSPMSDATDLPISGVSVGPERSQFFWT